MLEQLIAWWQALAARDPWAAMLVVVYSVVVACLTPTVVAGMALSVRDWHARRVGRAAQDAAYREYRGVGIQTPDGRTVGRLVGRSARRRAERQEPRP